MATTVPQQGLELRSLVTDEPSVELSLDEVEVREPGPGEVVVRVEAAPINPSDLGLLLASGDPTAVVPGGAPDRPTLNIPLPKGAAAAAGARVGRSMPVGNEGAGTVVAAGSDDVAQALLGRTVAVVGGGMYTQYRVLPAGQCLALAEGTPARDGAASFVNPMTVLAMIETMRLECHTALVHTAAASNLGQMLLRVCLADDIPLVAIVRSTDQVRLLKEAGAIHALDSTTEMFDDELTAALTDTGATLTFDAIGGGELSDRILAAMERVLSGGKDFASYGSATHKQIYVYGGLDRGPTTLNRRYGMAWGIGGWLLNNTLSRIGAERTSELRRRVAGELTTTFASSYSDEISLAQALDPKQLQRYARASTGGKYLITPQA